MKREYFLRRLIVGFLLLFLAACKPNPFHTNQQTYEIKDDDAIQTRSSDEQIITISVTILFAIEPESLERVSIYWPQGDYIDGVIYPVIRTTVREQISQYTAQDLYMGPVLETLSNNLELAVAEELLIEGFNLNGIFITDMEFTPEFQAAMTAAILATLEVRSYEEILATVH